MVVRSILNGGLSVDELLRKMDRAFAEAQVKQLAEEKRRAENGISLIIIAYNSGKVLFDAIDRALKEPMVKQLILIDNGSPERSAERLRDLKEKHSHILLLQGHGNIGFGRAANVGAILANQRWLVFLNPDAILKDNCLEAMITEAGRHTVPAIVGARILNTDGTEQRGARRGEVTPVTTLVSLLRLARFWPALKKFEIHKEHEPLPDTPVEVATISGACFAMRRSDFMAHKGFDARFFLHVEDVDLCWRVRKAGGSVIFHPKAEVIHEGHTSRVSPLFVEWKKGLGLTYYFRKRAKTLFQKAYVLALTPLIIGVSCARALRRKKLANEDV